MNTINITGKKAFVTGASSGIGRSIALALAAQGVDIALTGRDLTRLEATAADIAAISQVKTYCYPANLMVEAEAHSAVTKAAADLGGLDYLVNCAGVSQNKGYKIDEIDPAEFQRIMSSNVDSLLYCTQGAMPYLKESTGAYIINILSTAAFNTGAGGGMYSASKYAARALHEAIELGCKGTNIKVSAISPGPVKTNIWSHKIEEITESRKEFMLDPENIGNITVFLLTADPNMHIGNITVEPWFYRKN